MRKMFVFAAVLALAAMATAPAFAGWTEDFENGASNWTVANGAGPMTLDAAPIPSGLSYHVASAETERAFRTFTDTGTITFTGRFFDDVGTSNTSRGFIGLQHATGTSVGVDAALIRIGKNNAGTYFLHWYSTALQTVALAPLAEGWHDVMIKWSAGSFEYSLDGVGGTITNAALTVAPNAVALGYNYGNGTAGTGVDMWYDNIAVNAVPEPSSLLAMLTGLAGVAGIIRRKLA